MTDWAEAGTARRQVGRVGVWLGGLGRTPWPEAREAAQRIEAAGYGALWLSETPTGREPLAHSALMLGATERITVATGIASIWSRDALAARNGALALGEAHPGRFTLGLGVSHAPAVRMRGQEYNKPLTAMRAYLDALGAVPYEGAPPAEPVPLVLAALRPKMLELSAARTSGAHPYFVPVEHTRAARAALGPEPLLAPEVSVVVETDPVAARGRAREFMSLYLRLPNYTNNLRDLGWSDDDLADGGSDALVDAIVGWGDAEAVAARVKAHLDAGADHVCIQPVGTRSMDAVDEAEALAPLLLGL
ncbi:MAG TPA: TIGR03620 family F420-dependent LLM class oxidoreductase [Baekduia sp.]|nr:TIGR03620 family F420-dependent LLM class oxidoreductase [Baekduia sp.]